LYLGLFSLLATALLHFSWNVLDLGVKERTSRQVLSDARFLSERMTFFIRNAESLDESASAFDTASGKLVLKKMNSSDTQSIDIQNGMLMLTETGSSSLALHSNDSKVESLVFSHYGSQSDHSEYVSFVLTLASARNSEISPSQYQGTIVVHGGAFIRNSRNGL